MSRPLRIQYPNAVYHITCRGNERQNIFKDNADRQKFLQFLIQSLNIYTIKLYSYILMNNHFHLLLAGVRGSNLQSLHLRNVIEKRLRLNTPADWHLPAADFYCSTHPLLLLPKNT